MKVVKWFNFSSIGIFQNPLLASSLTAGQECHWLWVAVFTSFRSTQILTVPSFLEMTTIQRYQGGGTLTLEMIPKDSIRASSSTLLRWNNPGCVEGNWLKVNVNSPSSVPTPENRAGNWAVTSPRSSGPCPAPAIFARRLRSWIAGRPNRFCSKYWPRKASRKALWV